MKNSADAPRFRTDTLFRLAPGALRYSRSFDEAVKFITHVQLMDIRLWKLFVKQFCSDVDNKDKGWRCEYWGKMMRGACYIYSYTKDINLYQVMESSVRDLLTTQDSCGRFSTYSIPEEFQGWDIWGRKYILLGLQYFYELCPDDALCEQILQAMMSHLDYIIDKVGDEKGKIPITLTSDIWEGLNSSSLLEPVVRLYNLTKESRYLDFADYIVSNGGIQSGNIFELALEGNLYPYQYPVTKAYEMMSCFEGLIEYYRVTGIEKWRTAAENFAMSVMKSDITVIGCAGCTHELFDHSSIRQTDMERNKTTHMQETCVTVTWMKLCDQLLCLTGDSMYADCIERSAYNALLGAINTQQNTSSIIRTLDLYFSDNKEFYQMDFSKIILPFDSYSPLLPNIRGKAVGGFRVMEDGTYYGCCAAIGAAGIGLVPNTSVMRRKDGISVNLYLPGTVKSFTPTGNSLTLNLKTAYPAEDTIVLTVDMEKSETLTLALRIPDWSENTRLWVQGEPRMAQSGTYSEISREWTSGDTVILKLDFRVQALQQDGFICLRRGPVILARDMRLEKDIEAPVSILSNEDKSVCTMALATDVDCLESFSVLQSDGTTFPVMDYASAGKTWDLRSKMAAWYAQK